MFAYMRQLLKYQCKVLWKIAKCFVARDVKVCKYALKLFNIWFRNTNCSNLKFASKFTTRYIICMSFCYNGSLQLILHKLFLISLSVFTHHEHLFLSCEQLKNNCVLFTNFLFVIMCKSSNFYQPIAEAKSRSQVFAVVFDDCFVSGQIGGHD